MQVCKDPPENDRKIFGKHQKDEYFLESANKLHYFYESEALDKNGNLLVDKLQSINKVICCFDSYLHTKFIVNYSFKNLDWTWMPFSESNIPEVYI